MTTTSLTSGYAAFTREDVEDARRRGPDVDLRPFAEQRGLQYLGAALPAGFSPVLPVWPEYLANTIRGPFPGEHYGMLAHQLYEVGNPSGGLDMNGSFYGQRSVGRGGWFFDRTPKNEPFAASAIWVPTTTVAIRLPEAALVPRGMVRTADRFPFSVPSLKRYGVPGYRISGPLADDDDLLGRLLRGPAGSGLAGLAYPFVELRIEAGHLALTRNGYAKDAAALDRLVYEAVGLADALRAACRHRVTPQSFDAVLPPPAWTDPAWVPPPRSGLSNTHWQAAFRKAAHEQGLALEDPDQFHRAFPTQPVPGRAQGVLRGPLTGGAPSGRLAWFADAAHPVDGWVRGAVLLPARTGSTTPRGGFLVPDEELFVEVRDGIAAAWTQRRLRGQLTSRALRERGPATLGRLGLAEI